MINLLLFGQLKEILGEISVPAVADTATLISLLKKNYPVLETTAFMMAVNKKLVTENTPLTENCTVALLPPYSGG